MGHSRATLNQSLAALWWTTVIKPHYEWMNETFILEFMQHLSPSRKTQCCKLALPRNLESWRGNRWAHEPPVLWAEKVWTRDCVLLKNIFYNIEQFIKTSAVSSRFYFLASSTETRVLLKYTQPQNAATTTHVQMLIICVRLYKTVDSGGNAPQSRTAVRCVWFFYNGRHISQRAAV